MGKVKNLEKKPKSATQFDENSPKDRVKSINDGKLKKKSKKVNKSSALGGSIEKEVIPLVKEAKKEISKAKKSEKKTKKKTEESPTEVPAEVPEELAKRSVIKQAVKAAKAGIEKEKESATAKLFDEELRYGLQVVALKTPKIPAHTKKISLEHSLFGEQQPDVCFIIRDLKMKKTDRSVEEAIMKFEEKLKESGITGIKTILPLSKLKKDFGPNNMKLKLLNTYDLFLVEQEIADHTYTILGKHFIKKRKRPHQIDTSKTETMKLAIEKANRKVSFKLSSNSNFSIFEVGVHNMEDSKFVDNITSALEQLKEKWPGGWKNISRLYLKPMRNSKVSIPIYYSKIDPNDVEVPVEVGIKQSKLDKINEQLAKKSKKLRIDRKTKKVVKVALKSDDQTKENDMKTEKKDKKRKLNENDQENEKDEKKIKKKKQKSEDSEEKSSIKKKKKKLSESEEVPANLAEATADVNQEKKKKKKKNSEKETETADEPSVLETGKKMKKKKEKKIK
ncbi:CLUMA_CG009397, isoform A [Clunio marinus]|uniref:CLUMA_CG009397, isoform A n=1 Tax=Clunio marinus TaxID=568069 RepID=A0A1J1I889_9DIPT|nr:CLUMA_CG009397, isoform A [Clunio marinus]